MQSESTRVVLSAAILVIGLLATVVAVGFATPVDYSYGVLIDYGDLDIDYYPQNGEQTPLNALESSCSSSGIELVVEDGAVIAINGHSNDDVRSWTLYVVKKGSTAWVVESDPSVLSAYSAVCFGYCIEGDEPSPAVDVTGYNFYTYPTPTRVVSLAPSCTESLCVVGGEDLIVGTDLYSNYPTEIVDRKESGDISVVGGFTNPSYESVLSLNPDLVVCIGSQSNHVQMAEKLRAVGINVLVMDGGESIDSVMNNIYQAGVVLNNQSESVDVIETLENQMQEISGIITDSGVSEKRVMIALSAVKSPWVSGSDTYVSDVFACTLSYNIYDSESGWVQVNVETIAKYDPEVIIIVTSDYDATQADYDLMISSMTSEWRSTTAFDTGEIYLFSGDATDCASRAGPRVAELTELIGRAVHGDAFSDGGIPKFIGDDYHSYLAIAKEV